METRGNASNLIVDDLASEAFVAISVVVGTARTAHCCVVDVLANFALSACALVRAKLGSTVHSYLRLKIVLQFDIPGMIRI